MFLDLLLTSFKALASKPRLELVRTLILMDGPRSNQDIVQMTGLSLGEVSDGLTELFRAGIVTRRKSGRFVYYEIESEPLNKMIEFLDNGVVK